MYIVVTICVCTYSDTVILKSWSYKLYILTCLINMHARLSISIVLLIILQTNSQQVDQIKVNKNQNDFMKTLFGRKQHNYCQDVCPRAEILTIITLLFGPNCVFIKSFMFLLTFSWLLVCRNIRIECILK